MAQSDTPAPGRAAAKATLAGIIKPAPDDPDAVLFDPSHQGGLWVRIPRGLIEGATPMAERNGEPVVASVSLKASTPEEAALSGLVQAYAELLAVATQAMRGIDPAVGADAAARLQTIAAFETEEAAPWSDGPCQSECDRKYPDNWRQRWVCKLFCP